VPPMRGGRIDSSSAVRWAEPPPWARVSG